MQKKSKTLKISLNEYIRPFEIIANGLPKAEIIVAEEAHSTELFAAGELQKYVREITGVSLALVKQEQASAGYSIFVGANETAEKFGIKPVNNETDGFTIKTIDKQLFLTGNNPRASLYAVYHLLETLGCRWYEPGKVGEVLPQLKDIALDEIDLTEKPDFDIRSFWLLYLDRDDIIPVIDWMAKNRMNWVHCAHEFTSYDDCIQPISAEFEKRGIQIELGQHTLTSITFGLDPKLLETKPECFALVNGKRGGGLPLRICYTNPEARHLIARNLVDFCEKRPQIKRCCLLFRDGVTGWCECEQCKAIQPHKIDPLWNLPKVSDLYAYFIDNITTELKEKLPEMEFSMLAAYTTRELPENPTLLPNNPKVYVVLDHYERCHTHFLNGDSCEKNLIIREDNLKWKNAYPGNIWFWDMAAGTFDYNVGMVSPRTEIIRDSISFGKQLNAAGMITNWEDSQSLPSNQYLYACLLWNAEVKIVEMKDDFFKKYYGPSGEVMVDYAREFGEYPHAFKAFSGHRDQRALLAHLTDQRIAELKKLLKMAGQRVNEKQYQDRLEKANERLALMELWKKLDNTLEEALQIASQKTTHTEDHLFLTGNKEREKEERNAAINPHKIQQLEKEAENLFISIVEHNDPANKRIIASMRDRLALDKYNKVRMLGVKEERGLQNGGFEEGEKYFIPFWEFCVGWGIIDTEVAHSGKKSLSFYNPNFSQIYSIRQKVILNQQETRPVRIGGWYKTDKVEAGKAGEFSFMIQMLTDEKELPKAETVLLEPGTHSWEKMEKVIHPDAPIVEITFHLIYYRHRGKVWFDDLFLEKI